MVLWANFYFSILLGSNWMQEGRLHWAPLFLPAMRAVSQIFFKIRWLPY